MIPYFIAHKKGIKLNGKNPTIIFAYGSRGRIEKSLYNKRLTDFWLKNDGVFVLANIRGGGEFGLEWHAAAMKTKRMTAYNDFVAVATNLIMTKITSPEHIGIWGGSEGSLAMGVVMTQHPELFNTVICGRPVMDLLRYTEFGVGKNWIDEYGDPKDKKIMEYLKTYAPLEHIYKNKTYPNILITTSTNDTRVDPWHGRILQYMLEKHPTAKSWLLESKDGGHDGFSNLNDEKEYHTDAYTFLATNLGLKIRE